MKKEKLINECFEKSHDCAENAHCIDKMVGFSCRCDYGFNFNGTHCYEQNLAECRPIFKQYKASTDFTACKDATKDDCYIADENGQFIDFRLGCPTSKVVFGGFLEITLKKIHKCFN